jgi:aminoglycoside 3-N-acetyltransferase
VLREAISRFWPIARSRLRATYHRLRRRCIHAFRSYGKAELVEAMHELGIRPGDALMVHGGLSSSSGFRDAPSRFIEALLEAVGREGHLIMVSMPYLSSAYDYLRKGKPFDVRRAVSHMGIISETFRRHSGVLRSLHPANPVLAYGPRADWIVAGHEDCLHPCGLGSPFERIAQLNTKVLFYDVSMHNFTFFHYLEEMVQDRQPFPLFRDEVIEAQVIDHDGNVRVVRTRVFSDEAIRRRRLSVMSDELERKGLIRRARPGNSRLTLISTADAIRVVQELASRGVYFYE